MKVVFADIDGVFNHNQLYDALKPKAGQTVPSDWLDPDCITRLNHACELTGAVVVISSAWPLYLPEGLADVRVAMGQAGLTAEIIGDCATKIDHARIKPSETMIRWSAILNWLSRHPTASAWAILDDCDWAGFPLEKFVRTSIETGFQDEHALALVKILGKL